MKSKSSRLNLIVLGLNLGVSLGLFFGFIFPTIAHGSNVQVECWSGEHLLYRDTIKDTNLEIIENYVLIRKNYIARVIIGDCVLTQRIAQPHNNKHHAK